MATTPTTKRPGGGKAGRRQTEADRRSRLATVRAEQQRAERRRALITGGSTAVIVLLLIGAVTIGLQQRSTQRHRATLSALRGATTSPTAPTGTPITVSATPATTGAAKVPGATLYTTGSREHYTGPITYSLTPPVGGRHNPVWANCGVYNNPVPNENAVHSMEHGAVWVAYNPTSLSAADVDYLRQTVYSHPYELLAPYPGLSSPVVVTAWDVQLRLTSAHDARLTQFISAYRQGPQTPELGSPCTGGVGTPVG